MEYALTYNLGSTLKFYDVFGNPKIIIFAKNFCLRAALKS